MKLYNTASRSIEEFKPQDSKNVTFYTCGPTVYDFPHIGNWCAFIRSDTLNRVLSENGYSVAWVMNITDVGHLVSDEDEGEDKLEKGAKRDNLTAWEVAKKYTANFMKGLERLNIKTPSHLPKATDHIQDQISLVSILEKKGYTYVIDDGVYFDTSKFPVYGKMAKLDLTNQIEGSRVQINQQKKNPADFALWKFSPKDSKRDMEWDSPWGTGFPGWHIECSAMSMKYLGETLDIHAGGIDHIPVHHTNEIAQSEAATGKTFANYWVHSNFILVDSKKMAKSAGSFITLEDVIKKGYDPLAFRLLVLQSHYRTEAHFSWDNLEAAQNRLEQLRAWADLRHQPYVKDMSEELDSLWGSTLDDIDNALSNDMDTPTALASLSKLVNYMENNPIPANNGTNTGSALNKLDRLFGLDLDNRPDITDVQKSQIKKRADARVKKDWQTSDNIREDLLKQGLLIKDMPFGQIWSRVNTK